MPRRFNHTKHLTPSLLSGRACARVVRARETGQGVVTRERALTRACGREEDRLGSRRRPEKGDGLAVQRPAFEGTGKATKGTSEATEEVDHEVQA